MRGTNPDYETAKKTAKDQSQEQAGQPQKEKGQTQNKTMKSIVFYHLNHTPQKNVPEYSRVRVGCCRWTYVRAEAHQTDFETALANANPREGETVLNSVPTDTK